MRRLLIRVLASVALIVIASPAGAPGWVGVAAGASAVGCGHLNEGSCGVSEQGTHFHGLIAVPGSPWLLATAAQSGTEPGCGDCRWTIAIACPHESLNGPGTQQACAGAAGSASCPPRELLYRVYLSTRAFLDRVEGTVCIGGTDQVVPVSDRAAGDVERYLRNVTPPDLAITTRPATATLAGLPTYFLAQPPSDLAARPFGGDGVTEEITLTPLRVDWRFGDADASGWRSAGRTVRHTYRHGALAHAQLITRWGATYTITYGGSTFGPYDANGRLTRRQPFGLPVRTSSPVLVSR